MKYLAFLFLFTSSISAWAVSNRSIATVITEMRLLAGGGDVIYDLEGYNLAELVISLATQTGKVEEDTEFIFAYEDIQTEDEVVYGTTEAKVFAEILYSAIHFTDNDSLANEVVYSADDRQKIDTLLNELESLQPIYSWNPYGQWACGGYLTTPVVIDPQTKKAYELNFYRVDGCKGPL